MRNSLTEIFRDPPTLFTDRLMLRKIERFDSEDMYEYASLPEVTRFLTWDPHTDIGYTKKYLAFIAGKYKTFDFYDWAVCLLESGKMIGTCGFSRLDDRNMSGEIGYVINPLYSGHGYATEAARRVIEFGFSELGLERIEARYIVENLASRHIMDKLGMQFEGIHRSSLRQRGKYVSVGYCSILRNEI